MTAVTTVPPFQILQSAPALAVNGLTSGYGHTTVVRDVTIEVPASSVTALLGPNGAGKTTLIKTIAGLIRPSAGGIHLCGKDVTRLSPSKRDRLGMCLIPEGRGIFRSLTVKENLIVQSLRGEEDRAVDRAVEAFPRLGDRLNQTAGTLSGGEQQMLAVARAYTRNPELILIDEASLGLAPIVVDAIFEFLDKVTKDGAALLLVDQFVTRALKMASTAYVMRRGEIVYGGPAGELLDSDIFERYLGTS
jgi:branched-chain amino acid transport system ATP-binding protein